MDDLGIEPTGYEESAAHGGEVELTHGAVAAKADGAFADVSSSVVGAVNSAGDADIAGSCVGGVIAQGDVTISQAGAFDIVSKGDVRVHQGGAGLIVAGNEVEIDHGFGVLAVSRKAELKNSNVGFLLSGRTQLTEGSRVMLDGKAAAIFGLVFGGVMVLAFGALFGWGWWKLRRWRPHLDMPHFNLSHMDMPKLTWRERD